MLVDILEVSKGNNLALDLTGALVHESEMFLQTVEGSREQVLRKYVNILDDKPHLECKIVLIVSNNMHNAIVTTHTHPVQRDAGCAGGCCR